MPEVGVEIPIPPTAGHQGDSHAVQTGQIRVGRDAVQHMGKPVKMFRVPLSWIKNSNCFWNSLQFSSVEVLAYSMENRFIERESVCHASPPRGKVPSMQ